MKFSILFAGLMALSPIAVLAQTLQDEIDHVKYGAQLVTIRDRLQEARSQLAQLQSSRTALEQEIQSMSSDRQNLPGRNNALDQAIRNRESQIDQIDNQSQAIAQEVTRLMAELDRLEAVISQMRARWTREESVRVRIANDLAGLESQGRELDQALDKVVQQEREAQASLQRLSREGQGLEARRDELTGNRRDRVLRQEQYQRLLPAERRELQRISGDLAQARARVAPATQGLNGARAELAQKEEQLRQFQQQIAPVQQRVEGARGRVNTAASAVTALEREITDAQTSKRAAEQRLGVAQAAINNADNVRAGIERSIADNQALIPQLEAQLNAANAQVAIDQAAYDAARGNLRGENRGEMMLRRQELAEAERKLTASRDDAALKTKALGDARLAITRGQQALANSEQQLRAHQATVTTAQAEIARADEKVQASNAALPARRQELAQANQALAQVQSELNQLTTERDRLNPELQRQRQAVAQAERVLAEVTADVRKFEDQESRQTAQINGIEREIQDFPRDIQRIENGLREIAGELRRVGDIFDRENRQFERIQSNRVDIQRRIATLRDSMSGIAGQLEAQTQVTNRAAGELNANESARERLVSDINTKNAQIEQNNQTMRQLGEANRGDDAQIARNNARLSQIERDYSGRTARLAQLGQEVATASSRVTTIEAQERDGYSKYNERLALFQRYLGEASQLGATRGAPAGEAAGTASGNDQAQASATRLGGQSGADEGRLEAILRGFVRGELTGYSTGKEEGLASAEDAARGTQEGSTAGANRARTEANQVLRPAIYQQLFTERLKDDTIRREMHVQMLPIQRSAAPANRNKSARTTDIAPLTARELADSRALVTPLDNRIQDAIAQLSAVRQQRTGLSSAASVYLAPTDVRVPTAPANCQGVYRNVAEFVAACQAAFGREFTASYLANNRQAFLATYPNSFSGQVTASMATTLERDYRPRLTEGFDVAKVIGLAAGKAEVYQARFTEAEPVGHDRALPLERARVEREASDALDVHFANNGVASLAETPQLGSTQTFGVAPGNTIGLNLAIRNAGARPTIDGAVTVRLLSLSSNLTAERSIAPLSPLPARSISNVFAQFGLKVSDAARPGDRVEVVAEMTYPGHDYRATRTERIELREALGVNAGVTLALDYDRSPGVANLFGTIRTHEVQVSLTGLYNGTTRNHEVRIEEIGTQYAEIITGQVSAALRQGQRVRQTLRYKLKRAAKNKTVKFKITVRYGSDLVEEQEIEVRAD